MGLRRARRRSDYPLLLHFPYFDLYRKQVVKQADLVLAMHWRGDAFTAEEKARNFAYYEARTVRDSSLSACTQAVMAAEVGHLDLAYDYLAEAALMDLHDLEHNTRDGAAHRLAGRGVDRAGRRASAACATTTGSCRSRRGCPTGCDRLRVRADLARPASCGSTIDAQEATYTLDVGGRAIDAAAPRRAGRVSADNPVTMKIPARSVE